MSIRQRITDWLHECKVSAAFARLSGLIAAGAPKDEQRAAWAEFGELCARRSPEQVARMERARGLR